MYLRVFEYQWAERLSTLIAETLVIGTSATDLQFVPQYVLGEPTIITDSIENGRVGKKERMVSVPHARLERVKKASVAFTNSRIRSEDLSSAIDNFRTDYINFVGNDLATK